jgi:hypothetical protein
METLLEEPSSIIPAKQPTHMIGSWPNSKQFLVREKIDRLYDGRVPRQSHGHRRAVLLLVDPLRFRRGPLTIALPVSSPIPVSFSTAQNVTNFWFYSLTFPGSCNGHLEYNKYGRGRRRGAPLEPRIGLGGRGGASRAHEAQELLFPNYYCAHVRRAGNFREITGRHPNTSREFGNSGSSFTMRLGTPV